MRILLVALFAALTLAGCGGSPESAEPGAAAGPAAGAEAQAPVTGDAAVAAAPQLIQTLTDETTVYECPKCGMMFDAAGTCSMGCAELVATQVAYICPQDEQPVEQAGKCPRCPMNARVEKTAMAAAEAPEKH